MKPYKKITLEPTDGIVMSYVQEEKDCPHIIEKITDPCASLDFMQDVTNGKFREKINEIIEVVNIMMRGR